MRGTTNEPLTFVRAVEFHLHESFAVPVREVLQPPFELHDTGWGEFQTKMVVHFVDPAEDPITLIHTLRLYPLEGEPPTKGPVVSEMAEEIVFVDPGAQMEAALQRQGSVEQRVLPHPSLGDLVVLQGDSPDEAEMRVLRESVQVVKKRTIEARHRFDAAHREAGVLKAEVERLVREKSVVYGNQEIKQWQPESFRHVPMIGAHDVAMSAKKKGMAEVLEDEAQAALQSEQPRRGGPGRKRKKLKSGPKRKKI